MSVATTMAGEAVLEAVADGRDGRVEGVFSRGFYVSNPSGALFAVLGPGSWPGPLHLVVEELPVLPSVHETARVSDGVLEVGRLRVRLNGCRRWSPTLPEGLNADAVTWHRVVAEIAPDLAGALWAETGAERRNTVAVRSDPELARVWGVVGTDVRRGDLGAVFRRLQGRGAGLTPSGDDALAGILLVCAMDRSLRPVLADLVAGARTTRLSLAFLKWAAAGQSIEPAHTLLDAAAADDPAGMRRAASALTAVGATSGAALVAGAALAATELPRTMAPRPTEA